jgi:hypothetical protein
MVARWEGFHQQEVQLHHSRDIYQSLRRWGIGIAPWHQLPSRIGPRLRQWPGFFFQSRERARTDKSLDRIYGFAMTSTRFRDYMLRAMLMVGAADPHLHARHRVQAGDCAAVRVTYVSLLKAFQRNPDGALTLSCLLRPVLLSLRGRHDPCRIAQCGMTAFRTHFEVALVELNHSGAVADGHDRRLR